MATNRIFEDGRKLALAATAPTTPASGDPVLVGQMPGVALTDERSAGDTSIDFEGVYDLSVKAVDGAGNTTIAVGDAIYYTAGDTPVLSAKSSGTLFGHALEAIASSGATATIQVRLAGPASIGRANIPANGVTFAKAHVFVSTEQTGTGSAQNVAHGLAAVPAAVLVVPTDTAPATVGVYTAVEGSHTSTNVIVTVTSGKKFKVMAWA